MADTYKIVRYYRDRNCNKRTIQRRLTLAEAQTHCEDPQTKSSTCTTATGRARTRRLGPWFDGYERN